MRTARIVVKIKNKVQDDQTPSDEFIKKCELDYVIKQTNHKTRIFKDTYHVVLGRTTPHNAAWQRNNMTWTNHG